MAAARVLIILPYINTSSLSFVPLRTYQLDISQAGAPHTSSLGPQLVTMPPRGTVCHPLSDTLVALSCPAGDMPSSLPIHEQAWAHRTPRSQERCCPVSHVFALSELCSFPEPVLGRKTEPSPSLRRPFPPGHTGLSVGLLTSSSPPAA